MLRRLRRIYNICATALLALALLAAPRPSAPQSFGIFQVNGTAPLALAVNVTTALNVQPLINFLKFGTDWVADSNKSNVTISIASPGVLTLASNGYQVGVAVVLDTGGALPTPLAAETAYYVCNVIDVDHFSVSATNGGACINTSGTQSGTHQIRASSAGIFSRMSLTPTAIQQQ